MYQKEKIIEFPAHTIKSSPRNSASREIKYFTELQIKALRRVTKDASDLARNKGQVTGIREWIIVDVLTCTGIRVAECADLRCGDLHTAYGESELVIKNGKGNKPRTVQIPESLKKHMKSYLKWKKTKGESITNNSYLFKGQRGQMTVQAIQQIVKKYLKKIDLYENGKSVHALRHSYAVEYYRKTKDLRGLQKQLGHSSIQNTQIYADVSKEDIQKNIKGLWG
ncbi:MAG: tyrosine-type recombinase/integrase [Spirochaetia bacterium]|nr:tyrosine-type recombinase/integrase [Spirochaetia bacterium]